MEESTMKKHVTMVAALQIGLSTMGIIASVILMFVFSFASSFVQDVEVASLVLKFVGTVLPGMILVTSVLGLVGGIGLLSLRKWARVIVLIISAIDCFAFPVGTAVGVYSLWVLMQDETTKLFS